MALCIYDSSHDIRTLSCNPLLINILKAYFEIYVALDSSFYLNVDHTGLEIASLAQTTVV